MRFRSLKREWGPAVILAQVADKLRNLFRANVQAKCPYVAETAAGLQDKVLELVENMPTMPDIATRAMSLANDPNTNFADFARLIEGDATIATALLRYANSALYGGGSQAVKLHQAVVRLGMFQCKNLILSIGVKSLFRGMAGDTKAQCEALWHHGYVTGSLCRQLSRAYRLGFDGEEFSAGLLHDLGRILLVLADPECCTRAGALDFREEADKLRCERTAIGIDHCALGGWFGEHSKLPDTLIETMKFHHDPAGAEESPRLVLLVAAADHMANHVQIGEKTEAYNAEENPALTYLCASWPQPRKQRLFGEVTGMMDEAGRAAAGEQAA
jgi:HD-like signal output (HDOD) protein